MARIVRSPSALRDAAQIWTYVARDSETAADALIDRFDEKLALLSENPGLGTARPELRAGLRSFAIGNYLLFYMPVRGEIRVARILHAARDLAPELRGKSP